MNDSWFLIAGAICDRCGGLCCRDSHPPLSGDRIDEIIPDGHPSVDTEYRGYSCLAAGDDGMCVMFHAAICRIPNAETGKIADISLEEDVPC